jgi:putative transposase
MTSPKSKLAEIPFGDQLQADLQKALQGGLSELSLRPLLSALLSSVFQAERNAYLSQEPSDKGNGSYERSLCVGSMPLDILVPRSRSGRFRPATLPRRYQRGYSEEVQGILLSLLTSSRSISAAKSSLRELGLPVPESELEAITAEVVEDIDLRNTGPVEPDQVAIFMDGKHVEWREGGRLCSACIYVVIGISLDGKKRVLASEAHTGSESLEGWKKVLKSLITRGLRRVLLVVHDDFSGLVNQTKRLFPGADIQLCIVHMQRNAKSHLSKANTAEFMQRIKTIKACYDPELAAGLFEQMCDHFEKDAPAFIAGIRKKRPYYLAFLAYPEPVRLGFSTTNAVEAINSVLENMRRNTGGYFQSERTLKLKLGLIIAHLEDGTWNRYSSQIGAALPALRAMFDLRFDGAEGTQSF